MQLYVKTIRTALDAFSLYQRVSKGENHIFLDSSKQDLPYGRYSSMGANPFLTIKYEHDCIYEKRGDAPFLATDTQQTIFEYLNEKMEQYKVENPTKLPFVGGAIGYVSYDLGCRLEHIAMTSEPVAEVPEAYFVFYDNVVTVDHSTEQVSITGLGILEDAKKSVDALICQIEGEGQRGKLQEAPAETQPPPCFQSPFSAKEYKEAVETMRNYIREGDIYIANMTHTFSSPFQNDPQKTYETLRTVNPAPFSAYLPLEGFTVLCSSPERFLEVRKDQVETRPIKGTMPRGSTQEEDEENKRILEHSEKDKSELLMIVDLERNDLSKVCQPGTVKVTELFKTEAFATVFHLVSTVVGTLQDGCTAVDCLRATFPGGSITGAPKIRAMELIDALERNQRNLYTGSIGYFGFDGNAAFNIVIRSILIKDQLAHIGVGGGITWESDAQSEYEETIAKARALFRSLGADYSTESSW